MIDKPTAPQDITVKDLIEFLSRIDTHIKGNGNGSFNIVGCS